MPVRSYELTERGKIVIAVIIVLFLIALSAVLMVKAIANQSSAPPDNQDPSASWTPPPSPVETQPVVTDSPPPNGGGFNPPDTPSPTDDGGGGESAPPGNGRDPTKPPVFGPTGGNPSEGTLSFLFSPDFQEELDDETASLLDALLKSPENTLNSTIAVETLILSENYAEMLMTAVTGAFAAYGVPRHRIAHVLRLSATEDETFEVDLYFIPASEK